jgi:hypothetical protein
MPGYGQIDLQFKVDVVRVSLDIDNYCTVSLFFEQAYRSNRVYSRAIWPIQEFGPWSDNLNALTQERQLKSDSR